MTTTGYLRPGDPVNRLDDLLAAFAPTLRTAVRAGIAIELRGWVAALRAEADEVHGPPADPDEALGHVWGDRERALRGLADRVEERAAALDASDDVRPSRFLRDAADLAARASEVLAGSRADRPPLFVAAQTPAQALNCARKQRLASHSWSPM